MGDDQPTDNVPVESILLPKWKQDFIDYLLENKVLKIAPPGEYFTLKSGRRSKTFLNFGDIDSGTSIATLGEVFAETVIAENLIPDLIIGPAYKGIPIAVATAIALNAKGHKNVAFAFDRKEEKLHGEVTGKKEDAAKKLFVGRAPKDGMTILYVDDVITTGATKVDEHEKVKSVAPNVAIFGLVVAGNRQELDEEGEEAIPSLEEKLKTRVISILKVVDEVIPYLESKGKISPEIKREHNAYARTYGIESTKKWCRDIKFIEKDKGLIPACDVPFDTFVDLVEATSDVEQVTAYKIGFAALEDGLKSWTAIVKQSAPNKKIIYDHQKAGNDIPDVGGGFMAMLKRCDVDAIIIFPFAGPATQWEWTHSAFEQGLEVIVGAEMTHKKFKQSEGGYIADEALDRMYKLAAKSGVNNFVMPGNKPDRIKYYKEIIMKAVPNIQPMIYSPGLVAQGGKIEAGADAAGSRWQAIIGRGVYGDIKKQGRYYTKDEMRAATIEHASQLVPRKQPTESEFKEEYAKIAKL